MELRHELLLFGQEAFIEILQRGCAQPVIVNLHSLGLSLLVLRTRLQDIFKEKRRDPPEEVVVA